MEKIHAVLLGITVKLPRAVLRLCRALVHRFESGAMYIAIVGANRPWWLLVAHRRYQPQEART